MSFVHTAGLLLCDLPLDLGQPRFRPGHPLLEISQAGRRLGSHTVSDQLLDLGVVPGQIPL